MLSFIIKVFEKFRRCLSFKLSFLTFGLRFGGDEMTRSASFDIFRMARTASDVSWSVAIERSKTRQQRKLQCREALIGEDLLTADHWHQSHESPVGVVLWELLVQVEDLFWDRQRVMILTLDQWNICDADWRYECCFYTLDFSSWAPTLFEIWLRWIVQPNLFRGLLILVWLETSSWFCFKLDDPKLLCLMWVELLVETIKRAGLMIELDDWPVLEKLPAWMLCSDLPHLMHSHLEFRHHPRCPLESRPHQICLLNCLGWRCPESLVWRSCLQSELACWNFFPGQGSFDDSLC